MPMPREKWTDERLDDLNKKVDKGFDEMREGFSRVDGEIKDLRREMKEGFESLHRTLLAGALVIIAALIGLIGVSAF
ncbi:MAG TPA: hypothetical protein VLC07_06140 [Solirubrobacterales bacterium]|nr:hypothetical protein [Solirubrobacterales bacterium]